MNQKLIKKTIKLCETIIGARKGRLGNHYVFMPYLYAELVNEFHAELVAFQQGSATDPQPCRKFNDCLGFRETGCHLCEHCVNAGR